MAVTSSAVLPLPEAGSTELKVFLLCVGQPCAQVSVLRRVMLADPSSLSLLGTVAGVVTSTAILQRRGY